MLATRTRRYAVAHVLGGGDRSRLRAALGRGQPPRTEPRHVAAAQRSLPYFGNSSQVSLSPPQNSVHFAWSIGPLPITLANRKSAMYSISRFCRVAGGSAMRRPEARRSACLRP